MSTLRDRLMLAMAGPPRIRPSELARACKIKQPSINDWLSGRTKRISGPNLLNAARKLGVNPDWLATGLGPMRSGVQAYNNASDIDADLHKIPCIEPGDLSRFLYNSGDVKYDYIHTERIVPFSAFALKIRDGRMTPRFRDGDIVIIDPEKIPSPGNFVAAIVNEKETVFLKYRERRMGDDGKMIFDLVPINEDYPSLSSDVDAINIVGVMIEHRTFSLT